MQNASDHKNSIFIQIAAFKDAELSLTLLDLLDKAKFPNELFVGVCLQDEPGVLRRLKNALPDIGKKIAWVEMRPEFSMGACWARSVAMKAYSGQDYILQIDSHMRFVRHWDTLLIRLSRSVPTRKAAITTYPAGYTRANYISTRLPNKIAARGFDAQGVLQFEGVEMLDCLDHHCVSGMFVGGCFLFGPSALFVECPPIPEVCLEHEEESLSVRLFRAGWDIYHPTQHIVYHRWDRPKERTNRLEVQRLRPQRRQLQSEYEWMDRSSSYKYTRTLEAFESASGVNFQTHQLTRRALRGEFRF